MGPQLHGEAVGVAVVQADSVPPPDPIFIANPRPGARDLTGPEVPVIDPLHGGLLPTVEIADDGDRLRRWGKGAEHRPRLRQMPAQIAVGIKDLPRVKSVKIHSPS